MDPAPTCSSRVWTALMLLSIAGGCGAPGNGGVDASGVDAGPGFAQFCAAELASPTFCSEGCGSAEGNARLSCTSSWDALRSHVEAAAFEQCAAACAPGRACPQLDAGPAPDGGGGTGGSAGQRGLLNCDCLAGCARARGAGFNAVFETAMGCIAQNVSGACY
jgi:hypothetical protein